MPVQRSPKKDIGELFEHCFMFVYTSKKPVTMQNRMTFSQWYTHNYLWAHKHAKRTTQLGLLLHACTFLAVLVRIASLETVCMRMRINIYSAHDGFKRARACIPSLNTLTVTASVFLSTSCCVCEDCLFVFFTWRMSFTFQSFLRCLWIIIHKHLS